MLKSHNQKGFSMVELGVSLSIIAMIVAGVLTGASMKHHLELQQVVSDIGNYSQALKQFRTTYNALPGDMFNAEDVFGMANTDSGNGDEAISSATGTIDGSPGTVNEYALFYQHLYLAGLIKVDGGWQPSPFAQGSYSVDKGSLSTKTGIVFFNSKTAAGIISTKDAWDIDTKYDDGLPLTGKITAYKGSGEATGDCIVQSGTYPYNLTNNSEAPCNMVFRVE